MEPPPTAEVLLSFTPHTTVVPGSSPSSLAAASVIGPMMPSIGSSSGNLAGSMVQVLTSHGSYSVRSSRRLSQISMGSTVFCVAVKRPVSFILM